MMKVLALGLSAALAACTVGSGATSAGGGGGGGGTGPDAAVTPGGISGHIATSTTWMDTVNIVGDTTIDAGATVTVMPGAIINIAANANVIILGTLSAVGTSAGKITIQPANAAPHFGSPDSGITVGASAAGGTLTMNYVNMTGGSLRAVGSGAATIKDSTFSQADGDMLQMADTASMDFEYSSIGMATAGTDTTHCDMHFASGVALGTIKVSHSNVSTSSYGVMFYAGTNADFTYDNWFLNTTTNVDPTVGQVSGDFSNGYFDANPPMAVTGITANTLSTTMLATCLSDASNDASCAGPHR